MATVNRSFGRPILQALSAIGSLARRAGAVAAVFLAMPLTLTQALAEESWPTRAVKLVVPFAAGGPSDAVGRFVADGLARELGQPVLVENRPGAGASIGAATVAKAKPDGYTLLLGHAASVAATSQMRKVDYDPVKDFVPIAAVSGNFTLLAARKDFPANNMAELKALATGRPDAVSCGTAGVGSGSHITCEMLAELLGAKILMVHYKGSSETIKDLIGGRIDIFFDPSSLAHIRAGSVKVLGARGKGGARFSELPDIASFAEQGMPTVSDEVWFGLLAPAGTSPAIVKRVAAAAEKVAASPDAAEKLLRVSQFPSYIGSEELKTRIGQDMERYGGIIRKLGLRAN